MNKSLLFKNKIIDVSVNQRELQISSNKFNASVTRFVVSSSNKKSLNIVAKLYQSVIKAKITKAENIKSAEASKIIENTDFESDL